MSAYINEILSYLKFKPLSGEYFICRKKAGKKAKKRGKILWEASGTKSSPQGLKLHQELYKVFAYRNEISMARSNIDVKFKC